MATIEAVKRLSPSRSRRVVRRSGVSGGEVHQPEIRIDRRRLPHRRATVLPVVVVLRPGLAAELTRRRHGVERPDQLAVFRAVRFHPTAHAHVGPAEAGDDHAVVVERGADDGVALQRVFRLDGPRDLAGLLIERDAALRRAGRRTPCLRRARHRARPSRSTRARDSGRGSPCTSTGSCRCRRRWRTRRSRRSCSTARRRRTAAAPARVLRPQAGVEMRCAIPPSGSSPSRD